MLQSDHKRHQYTADYPSIVVHMYAIATAPTIQRVKLSIAIMSSIAIRLCVVLSFVMSFWCLDCFPPGEKMLLATDTPKHELTD